MDKQGTNIEKLVASLAELNQDLANLKGVVDTVEKKVKKVKHVVDLLIKKETKKTNKPLKERKPCGFAIPSNVSGDMCDFMGVEHGTPISRIQITKYINRYIKDNALENPENKQNIVPDDKLWKILGEEARDLRITHFTLQKHLNRHFIKTDKSLVSDKSSADLDTEKNVMTPNV
jgi:chromatin remodeling complex protein RSC6